MPSKTHHTENNIYIYIIIYIYIYADNNLLWYLTMSIIIPLELLNLILQSTKHKKEILTVKNTCHYYYYQTKNNKKNIT